MQYKVNFDIENFKFWSGAKDVFERCVQDDKLEELQRLIEDVFCDSKPSDTEINDFVWFDAFSLIFENAE